MRLAVAVLCAALFAGVTAGGVILAQQNSHLRAQVNTLIAQRNARHAAFCRYLHGQATAAGIPPALAHLASAAIQPEGCTS